MVNDFFISVYQQSWGNGSTGQLSLHQVKLKISHHTLKTSDGSIAPSKDLIFVMDDPPEEPTKKKAKTKKNSKDDASTAGVTTKNFGSNLSIPKFKHSSLLKTAWRCRLDSQQDGSKLVMPVQPIAVLAGMLEVESQNINLM
jgi:hypothetical protein